MICSTAFRSFLSVPALVALGLGAVGCGSSSTSTDVAYEDAYAGDYYYPTDVGYAGVYAAGWGYGIYAETPVSAGLSTLVSSIFDGGQSGHDGGILSRDGGLRSDAGISSTSIREGVAEAIRDAALGGTLCPGQVSISRQSGTTVCGESASGITMAFTSCQLPGGGTLDGSVTITLNRSASDSACDTTTTISLGYMSTLSNLAYTGTSGAKIVIPAQTSSSTINFGFGQTPTTIALDASGDIQRFDTSGSMTSDRTYSGTRTLSSLSLANQSYSVSGAVTMTDKSGGTGTVTGTNLMRDTSCCKPVGGTLSVSRTGGSHNGSHSWTYSGTCGSAELDGKTVTLPSCI
jgi:hypothetical protein